ncbi:MAG TPA: SUMF1/EgtB/PvdO family nonheme iron enzyme [Spirochaetia bacterium]|nr:SUMF1/EgtB/PvdO family nonheme iron enzyme [Spirochaetia bacterium]
MSPRKPKEPIPDFSDVQVKLKPIRGITPGLYLTILYSFILVLVLFMVLLFPGLKAFGTTISFHSRPARAALWIDGQYRGITPCSVFVSGGAHTFEFKKAFYKTVPIQEQTRGRIFGTVFFPLKRDMWSDLRVEDLEGLSEYSRKEFAEWGTLGEFSDNYQLPRILSEAAQAAWTVPAERASPTRDSLISLFSNAALFVDSPMELEELLRAVFYMETEGQIFQSVSLHRVMQAIFSFVFQHDTFPYWLALSLPTYQASPGGETIKTLTAEDVLSTPWFRSIHARYIQKLRTVNADSIKRGVLKPVYLDALIFHHVPGGLYLSGRDIDQALERIDRYLPFPARIEDFYMGETEVTNGQYSRFLSENPLWQKSNIESLVAGGKVTTSYLQDWIDGRLPAGSENYPVVNISHAAALAFCQWIESRLPGALAGYTVRLPHEEEWEWAVLSGTRIEGETSPQKFEPIPQPVDVFRSNRLGLKGMMGSVWEWSGDWSFPSKNLLISSLPVNVPGRENTAFTGTERVVKGGSWANREEEIRMYTRGSQPPDWCTPYLGFRVVLAPKP